jgi:hypothetical protein
VNCLAERCPVVAGECDRDGECYLWRCEHPHAPKPVSDDDLLAQFAELVLKVNAARFES